MNLDSDEQALRLLKAFYKVADLEAREIIIMLAESAERGVSISTIATTERRFQSAKTFNSPDPEIRV